MGLSRAEVLEQARAWVWVPADAVDEVTPEYRYVRYPSRTAVQWSETDRPVDDLVTELLARVARDTVPRLRWWVSDATRPADTEAVLARRGFVHVETVDVLARAIGDSPDTLPELDVPTDVTIVAVVEEPTLRVAATLDAEIFDWPPITEAQATAELEEIQRGLATGHWRLLRLVAELDGTPVGTAGSTLAGPAVRLWGAGVLPTARGRGVYRALLAARLRWAVEEGASMALVKGRTMTSAPVLRRAGFASYGEERCWEWTSPHKDV
jgi:GNAT superfamily N-acetyltransferase